MGGGSQIIELHWAIVVAFYQPSNRDCVINLSLVKSKCHSQAEKNGDEGFGGRQKRAGQVILFLFVISILFVISFVGVILIVLVISIVFVIQLCSSKKFCD